MQTFDPHRAIYVHGLEGSSRGHKATLLRAVYPTMLIPDFRGDLATRMDALRPLLGESPGWTIVGSSFGGLMAAIFTLERPAQVRKLILMAPALAHGLLPSRPGGPVDVPTVMIHGTRDTLLPLATTRPIAEQHFRRLELRIVDDEHGLGATASALDWRRLLEDELAA